MSCKKLEDIHKKILKKEIKLKYIQQKLQKNMYFNIQDENQRIIYKSLMFQIMSLPKKLRI